MVRRIAAVSAKSITASAGSFVGTDASRVALVFSPPTAASGLEYTVSTDPNVTLGGGLHLSAGDGVIALDVVTHGDAVTKAWYAIGSIAGPTTVGVLEVTET